MVFLLDRHDLKPGLILFRRADVKHRNWYCRSKLAGMDRYKVISLGTDDLRTATALAFERDMELQFQVKYKVPVFPKTFREAAVEYIALEKIRAAAGEISQRRWQTQLSFINAQLNPYIGHFRLAFIGEAHWKGYPQWRRQNGVGRFGRQVSDDTIRSEMKIMRAVMGYAVKMKYIEHSQLLTFQRKVKLVKNRRDYFTPEQYRQLCVFSRNRISQAKSTGCRFYRTLLYYFIQIMCETGMRPTEAKNLRWQDVTVQQDEGGRTIVVLRVSGKSMSRELVAPATVADHLQSIRTISQATAPGSHVFTTSKGIPTKSLYANPLEKLLKAAGLLIDSTGKQRSAYCFRHTYATSRLSSKVPELMLSEQMGTSVQNLQNHYGHITPRRNAGVILQGMDGYQAIKDTNNTLSPNA